MDAYAERIGSALKLEAQRSSKGRYGLEGLRSLLARWAGRKFSWLA